MMLVTLALSAVMMAGLFLLLWAGVGFIQDERFFSSAPQAAKDVLRPHKERFPGAHAIGWIMAVVAILLMVVPLVIGGWDGVRRGFGFWQFFTRFAVMLLAVKAFDILFFDFYLLCRSRFFSHYYPEVGPVLGPHIFGYNWKSHLVQIVLMLAASLVLAWVCTLFVS